MGSSFGHHIYGSLKEAFLHFQIPVPGGIAPEVSSQTWIEEGCASATMSYESQLSDRFSSLPARIFRYANRNVQLARETFLFGQSTLRN
jgi:hypothetical protein